MGEAPGGCGSSSGRALGAEHSEELLATQGPRWPPSICSLGSAGAEQLTAEQPSLNPHSARLP